MDPERKARAKASDTGAIGREDGAGFAAASVGQADQILHEAGAAIGVQVLHGGKVGGVVDAHRPHGGADGIRQSRTALRAERLHPIEVGAGGERSDGDGGDRGVDRPHGAEVGSVGGLQDGVVVVGGPSPRQSDFGDRDVAHLELRRGNERGRAGEGRVGRITSLAGSPHEVEVRGQRGQAAVGIAGRIAVDRVDLGEVRAVGRAEDLDAGGDVRTVGPGETDLRGGDRGGGEVRWRAGRRAGYRKEPEHGDTRLGAKIDLAVGHGGGRELDRAIELIAEAGLVAGIELDR